MHGKRLKTVIAMTLALAMQQTGYAMPTAPITIYTAKEIITMDPMQPTATAVAVQEGKILSVGSLDEIKAGMKAGTYEINTKFANDFITPGLIEAHSHLTMLAIFLENPYVGYWDFPGPKGTTLPAAKTKVDVLNRLKEADKKLSDPNAVLFAWGYDPIYFHNEDLTATDLDSISKTRPIFVLNASEHIGYVNSVLLKRAGYNAQTNVTGVLKGKDGQPTGVLEEMAAAGPVIMSFFNQLFSAESFKKGLYDVADVAHHVGLTTYSELLFGGPGEDVMVKTLHDAAADTSYPERMVIVYDGALLSLMESKTPGQGLAHLNNLIHQNSDKLYFGHVKFISDGSIQGFTARLEWPGYFNGAPNGIFNTTTEAFEKEALPFWKAGYPIHIHVNGNQATESALTGLEYLQNVAPRTPTLATLEHDQMSSVEQFKRTHDLGVNVNLFANHIYYWGDQHNTILLGPDRANRIDAAAEAKRQHIIFSLHTDSPVTPLGPLHSMWAAMNRVTASGKVLGEGQKISAEDALRAVTINAAYLLNLQNQIGSIVIGKRADFTVLARNPLTEPAMNIKDIPVAATIMDGKIYQ